MKLLLLAAAAIVSAPVAGEVPGVGPSAVVRAEVGELASVMAALKVHGGTLEPGFIASFQPYLGYRQYPENVTQHAWEAESGGQRHIIVWVDDPQDREPFILIVRAVYRPAGGGSISVFRTDPYGVLLSSMRSELTPYNPAGYSGRQAEAEFSSEKSYWKAWETTVRGKRRGAVRP